MKAICVSLLLALLCLNATAQENPTDSSASQTNSDYTPKPRRRHAIEMIYPLPDGRPIGMRVRAFGNSRSVNRFALLLNHRSRERDLKPDSGTGQGGNMRRILAEIQFQGGFEHHFLKKDSWENLRVSPYFGMMLGAGYSSYTSRYSGGKNPTDFVIYEGWIANDDIKLEQVEARTEGFVELRLLFGADFYFLPNAYFGFELSTGPRLSSFPEVEHRSYGKVRVIEPGASGFDVIQPVQGSLRLGVCF